MILLSNNILRGGKKSVRILYMYRKERGRGREGELTWRINTGLLDDEVLDKKELNYAIKIITIIIIITMSSTCINLTSVGISGSRLELGKGNV